MVRRMARDTLSTHLSLSAENCRPITAALWQATVFQWDWARRWWRGRPVGLLCSEWCSSWLRRQLQQQRRRRRHGRIMKRLTSCSRRSALQFAGAAQSNPAVHYVTQHWACPPIFTTGKRAYTVGSQTFSRCLYSPSTFIRRVTTSLLINQSINQSIRLYYAIRQHRNIKNYVKARKTVHKQHTN